MLLILILTNFLFSISSIDGLNLDYLIKDSGLAANKKSNLLLKNSINPADYFIGPGDEFFINVLSNNLSINKYLVVSPLGDMILPRLGLLNVDKMSINAAFKLIKNKYTDKFDNVDFNITLTDIRRFEVLIMGIEGGSFYIMTNPLDKVSDVYNKILRNKSNLFNQNNITNRNIILDRFGNLTKIDILDINVNKNSYNPHLLEEDIIILKSMSEKVNIYGGVINPGEFEFKENETLFDLINIVGGFTIDVDTSNITISRFDNQKIEKKIYIKTLLETKKLFLQPFDYINIQIKKNFKKRNLVYIGGEVVLPGYYVLDDDMSFKDLLLKSGGYSKNADSTKIVVKNKFFNSKVDSEYERIKLIPPEKRTQSEISYIKSRILIDNGVIMSTNNSFTEQVLNYELNQNDSVTIPVLMNYIEILGGVRNPGRYPFLISSTIDNYIEQAGGKTNSATSKVYIIDNTNQKNKVKRMTSTLKNGDILFVENKIDSNFWISIKESMGLIGQLATLIAVIQSAQNN